MNKLAFLYPGQGVQVCGMGYDFCRHSKTAADVFRRASEVLGFDMEELCFQKNDRLDLTEYTQAALVTTFLAITKVLKERGICPDVAAGLSLGEYAAIAAAGGMNELDAIRLVRKRGILMQDTVPAGKGAMCAILSLEEKKIEEVLKTRSGVTIANYNCPGQIVITGEKQAVEEASRALKEAGARRTVMLNVSGPFHSPMLKAAVPKLKEELKKVQINKLERPYISNVTAGMVTDEQKIEELLVQQLCSPVRWMQSMETMLDMGVDTFVEIGPGKTLEGFLRKINRDVKVIHVSCWEDLEQRKDLYGREKTGGGDRRLPGNRQGDRLAFG